MSSIGRRRRSFGHRSRIEFLETRSLLSVAGSLDPSFGSGLGSINPDAGILLTEPDGKILLAGVTPYTSTQTGHQDIPDPASFELQQFNADGSPDSTFGDGGKVIDTAVNVPLKAVSAALEPDGKIALVVATNQGSFDSSVFVAQFNADGTLDSTFGTGGIETLPSSPDGLSFSPSIGGIAVQPDNKIIIAGSRGYAAGSSIDGTDFAAIRLNTNGTFDTTFGTTGEVDIPFITDQYPMTGTPLSTAGATSVALQPNGQIVLAGDAGVATPPITPTQFTTDFAVTRLNVNGSIDTSFGGTSAAGKVLLPVVANSAGVTSVDGASLALQADGKILLAGTGRIGNATEGSQFILDRLNSDGTVDTAFGTSGESTITLPEGTALSTGSMVVQPSGDIVVSAQVINPGVLTLLRFTSNGTPDPLFSNTTVAGLVEYPQFYYVSDFGSTGLTLQANGNLLVAGVVGDINSIPADSHGPFVVASILAPPAALQQPPADYDGSGTTNIAAYIAQSGAFAYRPNNGSADVVVPFGISGIGQTIPAPGDYDGSGQTEIAAYLPSLGIYVYRPANGGPDVLVSFGLSGAGQSIPTPGDYFGTGVDDIAIYMPAFGAFAIRNPAGGPDEIIPFGFIGVGNTIPAPGDYFGTGQTDIAAYLPSIGSFAIRNPAGGPDEIIPFGIAGAGNSIPIPGDYDGSGKTELAVYFPKLGEFAYRPANGGPDVIVSFGAANDGSIPVPGDYDGSGKTEIAVFDPNYANFAYRPANGGADVIVAFGVPGQGSTLPPAAPVYSNIASASPSSVAVSASSVSSSVSSESVAVSVSKAPVPGGPMVKAANAKVRITSARPAQDDLSKSFV
jgi:uncharacterized delta-60 repeat protein